MIRVSRAGVTAALLVAGCFSSAVFAASQRSFVSRDGVDNPSCSIAAPCRGFAAAVTATAANGEVIVLDSAGYGAVTIAKAVSIIAPPGVYAGISVFSGLDGVTVAAGPADKVVLRGLTINGQGGNNGIRVTSGKETRIEDCTVANLGQTGILVQGGSIVHVARAVVRDNGVNGIFIAPAAAISINVTVTDSLLTGNQNPGLGMFTQTPGATIEAAATRVTSSSNSSSGFVANSFDVGTITLIVADSVAAENSGNGLFVSGANATAIVSGSSFVRNAPGGDLTVSGGLLRTAGNNAMTGRIGGDISGSLTPNPLK